MELWKNAETDRLCDALLQLKTREECYAFLEDICTVKEIVDISQRLEVARLLDKREPYSTIIQSTGASSATISRVSKCYDHGSGGYRTVLERIKKESTTEGALEHEHK